MIEHYLHSVLMCDFHYTTVEQQCVNVRYSECAAVHIQRAVGSANVSSDKV